jgi:hypothetical protein
MIMGTLVFVAFMTFLIKFSTERWWLFWFLIMGLVAQCGDKVGIIGLAVSMGISKVLQDLMKSK